MSRKLLWLVLVLGILGLASSFMLACGDDDDDDDDDEADVDDDADEDDDAEDDDVNDDADDDVDDDADDDVDDDADDDADDDCDENDLCARSVSVECEDLVAPGFDMAQCLGWYDQGAAACADMPGYIECNCICLDEPTCQDYFDCGTICFNDLC